MGGDIVFVITGIVAVTAGRAVLTRRLRLPRRMLKAALDIVRFFDRDTTQGRLISMERRRIAADIHDGALQFLIGALCSLRQAERLLEREEREHQAFQALTNGAQLLQAAVDEIRNVIFPLRSDGPVAPRLADQVQGMMRRLPSAASMVVHVAPLPDLSNAPAVEEAVAGIIGEALTNAAKHAQARNVWVEVSISHNAVTGLVRDDGIGFDLHETECQAQIRKNLGLYLIQERARLVGGDVTITSNPNAGTIVRARLPLRPPVETLREEPLRARANGASVGH